MNPSGLPGNIASALEKELKVELYDFEGSAAYYVANVGAADQYTAVCLAGKKLGTNVYCRKLTSNGILKTSLEEFRAFYNKCTGKKAPSFEKSGFHL
ncbi:hypothetical protein V3C99_003806 [Haemonchus contortus]|uniref:Methionyl-tRNA formyltransferase n=1 Tax=Haemonchus contortus TaxID=6289 RepID=A0A7I4Y047_HAECO|nr:unnamed protein product [Haemonchus contortus]